MNKTFIKRENYLGRMLLADALAKKAQKLGVFIQKGAPKADIADEIMRCE